MNIAIIGADGQLGSDCMQSLKGNKVFPFYYPDFDITKPEETRKSLSQLDIEIVINTAAFHRVDECEEKPLRAFEVNTIAVRDLALICKELNLILVHFSTDYVFDGKKETPYVEEDPPHPLNVYGVSKLAGEYFVRSILQRYFLIRTCGLFGEAGCWGKGANFVDTVISLEEKGEALRVVNDQWVTPTSTAELAQKIKELIQTQQYGLFHLTNEGKCTWFEFAETIFSLIKKGPQLIPVDSESYGALAVRPSYSVLENKKAKDIGLDEFSHWKDALKLYLKKKGYMS
ncbi:MAG: dTDP-4-dehydrorhamnose reductase [Candidatus Aminicenantes bacterium]|nr:MAG: dTDP-4-dehydrorhamnose reductase [Candidatus Aminicenantes bacterium]